MVLSFKAGRFWDNHKESGIARVSAVEYRSLQMTGSKADWG